jgi:tRNA (guanine-N7-)-methyltransferase
MPTVRTYHPRQSRLGPARRLALSRLGSGPGFTVEHPPTKGGHLDREGLFGRLAPLVVEIGSGSGEAIVAAAAANPDRDYLAVETHLPGAANLLMHLEREGPSNVRVAVGDALVLLRTTLPSASLDAVHTFFPDPWPKTRHHKRRLIQAPHVALIRDRLVPGGVLHCVTDWPPYAEQMLQVITADAELVSEFDRWAPRPPDRPVTKYEERAVQAGRTVFDVIARRHSSAASST